jgi:hypothetical protein
MTTTPPSIKGVVLANLINDVVELRNSGAISPDAIETRLEKADIELLETKPGPADWVPIDQFRRLSELLWELEGGCDPKYLQRRGHASAELVLASGVYPQVDFLMNRYDTSDLSSSRASLKLVVTLQGSLINFGDWLIEEDPIRENQLQIRITDATAFPEVLCHSMVGFLNRMAETRRNVALWFYERPTPDVVQFRMTGPII